jgi:hypothetical protein
MEQNYWELYSRSFCQEISPSFNGSYVLSPCLQEHAAGYSPQRDRPSQHAYINFI